MIELITASPGSGMTLSPFCSPPAAKTESIQGLAALVESGQAGGKPSIYSTFYANRDLWVNSVRRSHAAQDEVDLLRRQDKLSCASWSECSSSLRSDLRDQVKTATEYGLLLFLVA